MSWYGQIERSIPLYFFSSSSFLTCVARAFEIAMEERKINSFLSFLKTFVVSRAYEVMPRVGKKKQ